MGNGICSCNGPNNKNKDADLESKLLNDHRNITKGNITKKEEITDTNINKVDRLPNTIEHKNESESIAHNNNNNNNHISKANKLQKQFTLITEPMEKEKETHNNNKHNDKETEIKKLCVCSRNEEHLSLIFENNEYNFCNCFVLNVLYADISFIELNLNKFTNLRHFEMYKPQINGQRRTYNELYNVMNKILHELSKNLVSFKFVASVKHSYSNMSSVLTIPPNIEWLTFKNIGCQINISKCTQLIGLQLLQNMKYKQIIWPNILITFAAFCDGKDITENEWNNKCVKNELNVKYICLLKESFIDWKIGYNDNEMINKYELDINDKRKCIILKESQLNSADLSTKIMKYKFNNNMKLKSEKMLVYNDCEWIKGIGKVEYY